MNYFFGGSSSTKTETTSKLEKKDKSGPRKLRCRVGPSPQTLTTFNVNDDMHPHFIDSPHFVGYVVVRIKNFRGVTPLPTDPIPDIPYFNSKKRLFSLHVTGRFKQEHFVEDVVFGADFDKKVNPPTGSWLALKFANLIDPALQADIYTEKPWLLSPILCAMNILNVRQSVIPPTINILNADKFSISSKNSMRAILDEFSRASDSIETEPPHSEVLGEWVYGDRNELKENNSLLFNDDNAPFESDNIAERRKYFQKTEHHKKCSFKPDLVYDMEIFAPFMDLNSFDLTLGINVNLVRYLNHQPIRLLAKTKTTHTPLFVFEFDLIDSTGKGLANTFEYDENQDEEETPHLSNEEIESQVSQLTTSS